MLMCTIFTPFRDFTKSMLANCVVMTHIVSSQACLAWQIDTGFKQTINTVIQQIEHRNIYSTVTVVNYNSECLNLLSLEIGTRGGVRICV